MVIDAGGQRHKRPKGAEWVEIFKSVDAVLFVASLSCYDQVTEEDRKTNQLQEALDYMDFIVADEHLATKPKILFLNKTDLFRVKFQADKFWECTRAMSAAKQAPKSVEEGIATVRQLFERKMGNRDSNYFYETHATDIRTMDVTLAAVTDILLKDAFAAEFM